MSGVWVVDASVAIKWIVPEEGSEFAERLLAGSHHLAAPDFMLLEVDNLVCKLIRRDIVSQTEGSEMRAELRTIPVAYHSFGPLQEAAFDLANRSKRSLYDCIYLALAVALNGRLITADRPFFGEVHSRLPDLPVKWLSSL